MKKKVTYSAPEVKTLEFEATMIIMGSQEAMEQINSTKGCWEED